MASPTLRTRSLADHVAANLTRRCGIRRGDRLLVAVSGGADSLALLALLATLAPRLRLELEVASFDHALRADSAPDADCVAVRARELGLPCHVERWGAPLPGEAAARAARYAFLEATAVTRGCDAIATAHHLDDQIETVLLRLGRGAGMRGWLGMAWRRNGRVPVVRPLLDVQRDALGRHLRELGWEWREDPTNADPRLARNRIRLAVLPALDAALPAGWQDRWGASLGDLRLVWESLERRAARLLASARRPGTPESLALDPLRRSPALVCRQSLALWLGSSRDGGPSRRHLAAATRMIRNGQSGRTLELPGGWRLAREQDRVTLLPPGDRGALAAEPPPGSGVLRTTPLAGPSAWLELEQDRHDKSQAQSELPVTAPTEAAAWIDADAVASGLTLRVVRPGDRARLLGAPGNRSVRRILQDHAVPARLRAGWPVIEDAAGIVWLPGIGVADRVRLGPNTARALRLRFAAPTPGPGLRHQAPEP